MTIFQRWIIFMTYFWPLSREQLTFQIPRSVSKFNQRALWIVNELLKYIVLHLIYLHSTSYTYLEWTLIFMYACLFQSQKMCYNIMRKLIETWGESIFSLSSCPLYRRHSTVKLGLKRDGTDNKLMRFLRVWDIEGKIQRVGTLNSLGHPHAIW